MSERSVILAIDDDREALRLISEALGEAGYEVRLADGAALGLASAAALKPDLILLDTRLPEMDGAEVCRRLKADPHTCNLPVLFLSAVGGMAEKSAGFTAGASDYLVKPFIREELLARVRAHLDASRLRRDLERKAGELAVTVGRLVLERERFRVTLQGIGDALIATDAAGRITMMNTVAERLTGWTLAEAQSHPLGEIFRILDADTRRDITDPVRRVLESGEIVGLAGQAGQTLLLSRDGGEFRIADSAAPVHDVGGKAIGVVLVFRDITREVERRRELIQSEARYRAMVESMIDGFATHEILLDDAGTPADYRFLSVNPAFERLTGLKASALVGRTVLEVLPQTERHWIEVYGRVALTGEPAHFEHFSSALGKHFEVQAYRFAEKRFAVTFADITARRKAEAELARSEEKYRIVADNTFDWEFWRDPSGNLLYCSPSCLRISGRPAEEFIQDPGLLERIVIPEDRDAYQRHRREADQARRSGGVEFRILHLDGRMRWIEHNCQPVFAGDGAFLGIRGSNRDITDRKEAEQRLRDSEARIRQAQKMEAIGQLAGGVAHDFNNQLTGILGYADMLAGRTDDPTLRRFATNIKSAAQSAAGLTRQLLAFSRKGKNLILTVDLHKVIREAVALLERSLDKAITLRLELDAPESQVLGDPSLLQNAILNLAINARDAMPQGGTLLFATDLVELSGDASRPTLASGRHLRLRVRDTGTGMDEATLARIFEPFFTTKEQGKGTGLGLAAVYGTAESHGGKIEAESAPGRGSTFSLFLPLHAEPVAVVSEPRGEVVHGSGRILLVDDEAVVRQLGADLLGSLGYAVTLCSGGEEAIALLQRTGEDFDLLIVDMVMPRMDGEETFLALRGLRPGLRALLASGYAQDGRTQAALDSGMSGFVQKPFDAAILSKAVAEILAHP